MKHRSLFACFLAVVLIILSICAIAFLQGTLVSGSQRVHSGIVTDRAMAKVREEDWNGRPYIIVEAEDGTVQTFWFSRAYARRDFILTLLQNGTGVTDAAVGDYVKVDAATEQQTGLPVVTNIQILPDPS